MWEPRKSLKIRVIILIVLSGSFVPISYLWYGVLSELDCKKPDQNYMIVNSNDVHNICMPKTDSHWMIFYGVNTMIYGMPLVTLILNSRNRTAKDL